MFVWWQKHREMEASRPYWQDVRKFNNSIFKVRKTHSPFNALSHQTQLSSIAVLSWAERSWRQGWYSQLLTLDKTNPCGWPSFLREYLVHVGYAIISQLNEVLWTMVCRNSSHSLLAQPVFLIKLQWISTWIRLLTTGQLWAGIYSFRVFCKAQNMNTAPEDSSVWPQATE